MEVENSTKNYPLEETAETVSPNLNGNKFKRIPPNFSHGCFRTINVLVTDMLIKYYLVFIL